jgi:hypothetical protein
MSFRKGSYERYEQEQRTVKIPKSEQQEFQILDAGTHLGVCTWVVGIGMQETEWQGVTKEQEKLKLRFEVPSERVTWTTKEGEEHEGPMVIWLTVTASMHENARLRKLVQSWLGRKLDEMEAANFDTDALLGAPCLLNVVHREYNGKTYANIESIAPLMKMMEAPKPEGELISFDPYSHTPDEFAKLPNWLQELVNKGVALREEQRARAKAGFTQVKKASTAYAGAAGGEDDIPF